MHLTAGKAGPFRREPRRFDLYAANRHQDCRRRRRQLRSWLRGLMLFRLPDYGDMT